MNTVLAKIPFVKSRLDSHMQEVVIGAATALSLRLLGAVSAFGFNVVLARMLGAEGAGIYYLALAVTTFATVFGRMGLDFAMVRFTAAGADSGDWASVKGLYRKGMAMSLIASLVSALVVFLVSPWLSDTIFNKPQLAIPMRLMALAVVPMSMVFLHAEMLRGLKRIRDTQLIKVIGVPTFSLLGLILLARIWGVTGAVSAYIIAAVITALAGFFIWRRATPQFRDLTGYFETKKLLNSCMPLLIATLMNISINWVSILVLGVWGSKEDVGIYSMAFRTVMLMGLILTAVNSITAPKFAALYAKSDIKALSLTARHSATLMTLLVSPLFLLFLFVPGFIMSIFGSQFSSGGNILTVLAIGQFVNVVMGSVGYLLVMSGNETLMRNITIVAALINIVLHLILVPLAGLLGAAIATTLSLTIMNVFLAYFAWLRLNIWIIPFLPVRA